MLRILLEITKLDFDIVIGLLQIGSRGCAIVMRRFVAGGGRSLGRFVGHCGNSAPEAHVDTTE